MLNRRNFIRGISASAAGASLWTVSAEQAHANPMGILAAMNLAATAIGLFAQGGNGLAAMMDAQIKLIELVVDQLKRVQQQLNDISDKISKLPEEFERVSKNQYARGLMQEIAGAAGNYAIQLEAFKSDQTIFNNAQVQGQLKSILDQTAQRRSTLSYISEGCGPEAAFVVPVSWGVEIAALRRLNFPPAIVMANLTAYDAWISRMLGNGPGSIQSVIDACATEHNTQLSKAAEFTWAKDALKIEKFKLGQDDPEREGGEQFCVVGGRDAGFAGPFYIPVEQKLKQMLIVRHFGLSMVQSGEISSVFNSEVDAKLLSYKDSYSATGVAKVVNNSGRIEGIFSNKTWCYYDGPTPLTDNHEAVFQWGKGSRAYQRFAVERAQFEALIANANLQRAKIAFALKSRVSAIDAQSQVRSMMDLLR